MARQKLKRQPLQDKQRSKVAHVRGVAPARSVCTRADEAVTNMNFCLWCTQAFNLPFPPTKRAVCSFLAASLSRADSPVARGHDRSKATANLAACTLGRRVYAVNTLRSQEHEGTGIN